MTGVGASFPFPLAAAQACGHAMAALGALQPVADDAAYWARMPRRRHSLCLRSPRSAE